MAQNYKNIRLFENPVLESLSHVHPATPAILWIPVILYHFWQAFTVDGLALATVLGLTLAGFLVWTLAEYTLHRYVFHWEPKSQWGQRFVYVMHGNHHDEPNDPTRLVMPPFPAIAIASVFYWLFYAILGGHFISPFFAGFLLGYLAYDYTHFAVHHFTPRTPWGRFIKKYHMMHHFVQYEAKWGVSTPLWDYVFGTSEPSSESKPAA